MISPTTVSMTEAATEGGSLAGSGSHDGETLALGDDEDGEVEKVSVFDDGLDDDGVLGDVGPVLPTAGVSPAGGKMGGAPPVPPIEGIHGMIHG